MTFTFLEQAVLNVIGPVVTVCFGSVAVAGVANLVSGRAQKRREQIDLRQAFATEMAEVAYDIYFRCVHLDRGRRHGELADAGLAEALAALDRDYVNKRIAMGSLQSRLHLYFGEASNAGRCWHQVIDLLTMGYFHVCGSSKARLLELGTALAGDRHTGLTAVELRDPDRVRNALQPALLRSTRAVRAARFERRHRI